MDSLLFALILIYENNPAGLYEVDLVVSVLQVVSFIGEAEAASRLSDLVRKLIAPAASYFSDALQADVSRASELIYQVETITTSSTIAPQETGSVMAPLSKTTS